jgi:alkanesulfonate monooxygenase SsuD/methylene tetrahydromethanopterin reductase-like flavin-dependent oxidoreductase (luciferase family)
MSLEAAEQIANMMVMSPYPGFEGRSFRMPCRNVLPKPLQKPHPPMWMACSNRDTIRIAASRGLGALAFSFIDEAEARTWSSIYYDIIKSDACVPLGHSVNANIAMVSAFSLNADREEAARRGLEGFEFFRFAISALVTHDTVPGRSRLFETFREQRAGGPMLDASPARAESLASAFQGSGGIGTPADFRAHARTFETAGVDQIILLQQAGRNRHEHICESMELLGREVLPVFAAEAPERERRKAEELAPYIEKALARKERVAPLGDADIPVVRASVAKPIVNQSGIAQAGE